MLEQGCVRLCANLSQTVTAPTKCSAPQRAGRRALCLWSPFPGILLPSLGYEHYCHRFTSVHGNRGSESVRTRPYNTARQHTTGAQAPSACLPSPGLHFRASAQLAPKACELSGFTRISSFGDLTGLSGDQGRALRN